MAQTLSLTDITKDFGGGPVLAGISLDIAPGELVAVMGPSGSGKSTLLHCMSGVLTPTHGSVRYGEEELSALGDAPVPALVSATSASSSKTASSCRS